MDIKNIDTTIYENRIKLGLCNEKIFKKILDETDIIFEETNRYYTFDYLYNTENDIIFVELKTRKIKLISYDTAIIAKNKLVFFDRLTDKRTKHLYIIYGFLNKSEDNIEYYYIKFNKKLFKTFNEKIIFNKLHLEIPTSLLKPFEYFKKDIQFDLNIDNDIDL
jgi:hypothetical protein